MKKYLVYFKDLEVGDVCFDDFGNVFMKINLLSFSYYAYNVINLKTGKLGCYNDDRLFKKWSKPKEELCNYLFNSNLEVFKK